MFWPRGRGLSLTACSLLWWVIYKSNISHLWSLWLVLILICGSLPSPKLLFTKKKFLPLVKRIIFTIAKLADAHETHQTEITPKKKKTKLNTWFVVCKQKASWKKKKGLAKCYETHKQWNKKARSTIAYFWCDGHSISISVCGM